MSDQRHSTFPLTCSEFSEAGPRNPPAVAGWPLLGLLLLLSVWMAGCASKGPMPGVATDLLPPMSESGETIAPARWWTAFEDGGLDREVNLALGENFDLSVALSRLRAARALTRREASDWYWDLNGVADTTHTFGPGPNRTRTNIGLDASYQVDLWGQIQSRVDAERYRTEATRADYHAVALSLSAEVARTWFALIEGYAQLELLKQQEKTNREGLKSVELRYAEIGEGGPNVLRQEQLVQSTREQRVVVQASVEVLEHQLGVLTGQPPQAVSYSPGNELPELPAMPFTGLPSELLNRRPDVRAAYLALAAADRDVAAAVSDQYPRLNLGASLINSAESSEAFFRDWFLSIGGQLIGPILDGGQRRAEVARTRAVVCQRFGEYRQTILQALQDVEDGLALERRQVERIELLEAQLEKAELASQQLLQYFITGNTSYLDVLSTVQSQQRLQRSILSARLDLILIRIGLYLALAGDFDTRPMAESVESIELLSDISRLPSEVQSPAAVDQDTDAGSTKPDNINADNASPAPIVIPATIPADESVDSTAPPPTQVSPVPADLSALVIPAQELDLNE